MKGHGVRVFGHVDDDDAALWQVGDDLVDAAVTGLTRLSWRGELESKDAMMVPAKSLLATAPMLLLAAHGGMAAASTPAST